MEQVEKFIHGYLQKVVHKAVEEFVRKNNSFLCG